MSDLLRRAREAGGFDDHAVLISELADEVVRLHNALRSIEIETHSSQEFQPHSMQIIRNIIQSAMEKPNV